MMEICESIPSTSPASQEEALETGSLQDNMSTTGDGDRSLSEALVQPCSHCGDRARLRAGGVILRKGETCPIEVLFVSRRKAPESLTVPAGKFEHDLDAGSFEACAIRETREEAGVDAKIIFDLGWYRGAAKDACETRTRFFAMLFESAHSEWEESERRRVWKPVSEAKATVAWNHVLKEVFHRVEKILKERTASGGDPLDPNLQMAPLATLGGNSSRTLRLGSNAESVASMSSDDSLSPAHKDAELQTPCPIDSQNCFVSPAASPCCTPLTCVGSADVKVTPENSFVPQDSPKGVDLSVPSSSRKVSIDEIPNVQIQDIDGERFCFYSNQVGGHFCLVKPAPESTRILVTSQTKAGTHTVELPARLVVLKPKDDKEYQFYQEILDETPSFAAHIPRLFGTKSLSHRQVSDMTAEVDQIIAKGESTPLEERMRSHQFQKYVVLEDLAEGMKKPRILDLKMGFKQRSQHHSLRKRERCRMKAMTSTSHFLGFRICGIQREDTLFDKYWGRRLQVAEMESVLSQFFLPENASADDRHRILTSFIEQLQSMRDVVSTMPRWRFWSTSLLFLFDGDDFGCQPKVRIIDFAHCVQVRGSTTDAEFLCSLWNIQAFLEALRDGHHYEPWIVARLGKRPEEAIQDAEELEADTFQEELLELES